MASPENVSELVLYSLITVFILVLLFFIIRVSPLGKKMKQDESKWDFSQPVIPGVRSRQKYTDPLSSVAVRYMLGGFGFALVIAFIYYFIARGGLGPGN